LCDTHVLEKMKKTIICFSLVYTFFCLYSQAQNQNDIILSQLRKLSMNTERMDYLDSIVNKQWQP